MVRKTCQHCKAKPVNRPNCLCWACYYAPGVRYLYKSTSPYARRGVGNGQLHSAPLPKPTTAEPGTEEKVLVLMARAERGEQLFHPDDPTLGAAAVPWEVPSGSVVLFDNPNYGDGYSENQAGKFE